MQDRKKIISYLKNRTICEKSVSNTYSKTLQHIEDEHPGILQKNLNKLPIRMTGLTTKEYATYRKIGNIKFFIGLNTETKFNFLQQTIKTLGLENEISLDIRLVSKHEMKDIEELETYREISRKYR